MDKKLHEELLSETEKLRNLIGEYSTRSVVGSCYFILNPQFNNVNKENHPNLSSKVNQIFFLLGLMLTTEEPQNGKDFGKENWKEVGDLLESIYNTYFFHFLKSTLDSPDKSKEMLEKHDVVMKYFLSYFNNGLLASFEQVKDRINRYLPPFDSQLKNLIGISASDSLEVVEWIHKNLQKQSDKLGAAFLEHFEDMQGLFEKSQRGNWKLDKIREEAQKTNLLSQAKQINNLIDKNAKVELQEIEKKFGIEKAAAFWNNFVSRRGEFRNFQYLTDRNLAEEKTLFEVEKDIAFCLAVNVLYWAILRVCEQTLLEEKQTKQSYEKKRGKLFDNEVEDIFRKYFPASAVILSNVYETQDLQNEHDLIILWEKRLFIIENKSSPPNAPFRDPEKSFTRIKREFQSEAGIQKAYDQTIRIYRRLKSGEKVELFDERRKLVETLSPVDIKKIYCICVTRDNFGPLATDLSVLLNKKEAEPYPWVTDVFNLEAFFDAWKHFKWNPFKFCEYLNQRESLHGKVVSSEELELAGYFIKHGSFKDITGTKTARVVLDASYSDVFDEIYMTKYGGKEVTFQPQNPVLMDSRNIMREATKGKKYNEGVKQEKKIGVNAPCYCGSGKKYKKCHMA